MIHKSPRNISVFEFGCQAPLKFLEHCNNCPRFGDGCTDLALGKEILRGKKNVDYHDEGTYNDISAKAFNCLAPLYYFEKSRMNCGHRGRCREEGLLLALLDGKKALDYSYKEIAELPVPKRRKSSKARVARKKAAS